ncbi:TPA: helix-turn-helix domain-containing protein [Streptococcus suis]
MNLLAEKLRLKRKELGLSQQALATGICEQSQISKIERGRFMPSAELLFKLSQRLEVPLDYFFNEQLEVKSTLSNFKKLSSKLLDDRNYDDLEYIYSLEIEKNNDLSLDDRVYLEWIKSIIDFQKDHKKSETIKHLENQLQKLSSTSPTYLKMLNTLANFYSLVGREQEYESIYSRLIEIYLSHNLDNQEFMFGYIRVRFNYAYFLQMKERYSEAIQEAVETIEFCKLKQTSYQLAPLLIILGNSGMQFMDKEEVKNYYIEARNLCKIYDSPLLLMKIEEYLYELDKNISDNS